MFRDILFQPVFAIRDIWHLGADLDPHLWLMDPDPHPTPDPSPTPDPTPFFSDFKDAKKKKKFHIFFL